MSRKDYRLIAAALKEARTSSAEQNAGIDVAAYAVARALRTDNYRFDRDKFLRAAGVIDE